MKPGPKILLMVILGLTPGSIGHAGPLRIALLSQATVTGDAIMLSRLLPVNSAQEVKAWAEKVALGSAPQVGFERKLGRGEIAQAIRSAARSREEFAIPETVVVRREGLEISRNEIFDLLRRELAARGRLQATEIRPEDVELPSAWEFSGDPKGMRLKELLVDPLLGRMRFRLRWVGSSSAPELCGWLRLKENESGVRTAAAYGVSEELTAKPIVEARRPALLFLHSLNSETLVRVRVLQPGRLGESIRVRIPANGHTLLAKVVGQDRLEVSF